MAVAFGDIWKALALSFDDLMIQAVTSGTSTTGVFDLLINATTAASTDRFNNRWVYVLSGATAGQQVRVRPGGYAPSTGTLTVYPDWVAPALSDQVAITALFPVRSNPVGAALRTNNDDADYFTLCNRALARLIIPTRITTPITTSDSYSLAAWPWLDNGLRLIRDELGNLRILEPSITSGQRPVSSAWRGWRLVVQGTGTHLEVDAPFASASGTLTIEAMRLANTLATGVEVTAITTDAATVDVTLEDVLPVAKFEAYSALANRPSNPFPRAAELASFWLGESRKLRYFDRTMSVEAPPSEEAA